MTREEFMAAVTQEAVTKVVVIAIMQARIKQVKALKARLEQGPDNCPSAR